MTRSTPGRIPTSPTTPTSLSHLAMPQSATSCVVVRDGTGRSFDMLNVNRQCKDCDFVHLRFFLKISNLENCFLWWYRRRFFHHFGHLSQEVGFEDRQSIFQSLQWKDFQPGLNNEEEPNAIHLITMRSLGKRSISIYLRKNIFFQCRSKNKCKSYWNESGKKYTRLHFILDKQSIFQSSQWKEFSTWSQ